MPLHPLLIKTKLYKPFLAITKPVKKLHQYLQYLSWVDEHTSRSGFNDYYNAGHAYERRYELHDHIIESQKLTNTPIRYYEFGVAAGDMMKFWVGKNTHEASRFYGFDSFEGLPESWEDKAKGHFSADGNFPDIDDKRASFIKGWFQDTVYGFFRSYQAEEPSIYHLDADIFSATLYVLFHIQPFLKEGDILIFDEFSSFEDEYKAWEIFKGCYGKPLSYKFLGAINNYRQIAIKLT